MKIKNPLLVAGAATAIGIAGVTGGALVNAESSSNGQDGLVTKIAQKFNLKKEDVQAVFDQDHKDREVQQQADVEKELSQLVTNGKISNEQKDKILSKRKELQAQREADKTSMENKSESERKSAMDAKRSELEKWAKDNNIPTEYLRYVAGHGGKGGPGGPGGFKGER